MRHRRGTALALAALALSTADVAAAAPRPPTPYTVKRAPYRAEARFVVTYTGAGAWRTDYHATPPNDGGAPDTNDAHDASTQTWSIRLSHRLSVPACGQPDLNDDDACQAVGDLDGARGATRYEGKIDHVHVDGLYRQLDRTVRCRLKMSTKRTRRVDATVGFVYSPTTRSFAVTAYSPVATVLTNMRSACPDQGDSIERIADNYFTPGFSFDTHYDAYRWFTSRTVTIPARDLHHASRIRIQLGDTAAGTPPRDCSVQNPSYERCAARGRWGGVMTLRAAP